MAWSVCHGRAHRMGSAALNSRIGRPGAVDTRPGRVQGHGCTKLASMGVVITGGSKGLGYCMASEFLSLGDRVVICGRSLDRLTASMKSLQDCHPGGEVYSLECDVSNAEDIARFGKFAQEKLGIVDRWINNAGEIAQKKLLSDLDASEIAGVVGTNVLGSLLGCGEAIRIMKSQPSFTEPKYHILNLGFSSWGAAFSKSACTHKTTKVALAQLSESLSQDLEGAGISSIGVHNLSPGMVLTDLLLKDASPVAKRFFNALAEEPETVAKDIVPKIRILQGTNQGVEFLKPLDAFTRVVGGVPQILFGGRFFTKDGERVRIPNKQYKSNGVEVLYDIEEGKY